jgi:hypothetical protein
MARMVPRLGSLWSHDKKIRVVRPFSLPPIDLVRATTGKMNAWSARPDRLDKPSGELLQSEDEGYAGHPLEH